MFLKNFKEEFLEQLKEAVALLDDDTVQKDHVEIINGLEVINFNVPGAI